MGLISFSVLIGMVGWVIWIHIVDPEERADTKDAFLKDPVKLTANLFYPLLLVGSLVGFVLGIFSNGYNGAKFFNTGLETWQASGISSLVLAFLPFFFGK